MPMSAEIIEATKEEIQVDVQKRAFMSKFGKYAVAGAGMAVLMTPTASSATNYFTGSVAQVSRKRPNGNIVTRGAWETEDGSHQGLFRGRGVRAEGNNYDYRGRFRDLEQGQNYKWSGSMTYAEDRTWSGSGDIYKNGTDVGDWSSSGTGFWGRFTAWWGS